MGIIAGHSDQGIFFVMEEVLFQEVAKLSEVDPIKQASDKAIVLMTFCTSQYLRYVRKDGAEVF